MRAQLLRVLYSIRSERLLMEEIDCSMLFRWFVSLNSEERLKTTKLGVEGSERGRQACTEGNLVCYNSVHRAGTDVLDRGGLPA